MRRWMVVCAACGGAPAHLPDNAASGHDPELAVVSGPQVRVYLITPKGPQLERTVDLPSTVGTLAWVGDTPVVQLQAPPWSDETATSDPKRDGEIGRIGKTFEPFAVLPASAWIPNPPKDADGMISSIADHPAWRMIVTSTGEIWQGRSEWYFVPDAGGPTNWVFVRLAPGPPAPTTDEPAEANGYPLPTVAPPASPIAELVSTGPKEEEGTIKPENLLRCTMDGKAVELPPDGEARSGLFNVDSLAWLATDPPLFSVEEVREGYTAIVTQVFYEGCKPSDTLRTVAAGPDGVIAVYGTSELRVVAHGRVIGTVPGGSSAVFRRSL